MIGPKSLEVGTPGALRGSTDSMPHPTSLSSCALRMSCFNGNGLDAHAA